MGSVPPGHRASERALGAPLSEAALQPLSWPGLYLILKGFSVPFLKQEREISKFGQSQYSFYFRLVSDNK